MTNQFAMLPLYPELQAIIVGLLDPPSFGSALSVSTEWNQTLNKSPAYIEYVAVSNLSDLYDKIKVALEKGYTWILSHYPDRSKKIFTTSYQNICMKGSLASVKWFFENSDNELIESVLKLYIDPKCLYCNSPYPYDKKDIMYGILRYGCHYDVSICKYLYGVIKQKYLDSICKNDLFHPLFIMVCGTGDLEMIKEILYINSTWSSPFNVFDSSRDCDALVFAGSANNMVIVNYLFELESIGAHKFTNPQRIFNCFITMVRMRQFKIADLLYKLSLKYNVTFDFEKDIWGSYIRNITGSNKSVGYLVKNNFATCNFLFRNIYWWLRTNHDNLTIYLIRLISKRGDKINSQTLNVLFIDGNYCVIEQIFSAPETISKDAGLEDLCTEQHLKRYDKHKMVNTLKYFYENFRVSIR